MRPLKTLTGELVFEIIIAIYITIMMKICIMPDQDLYQRGYQSCHLFQMGEDLAVDFVQPKEQSGIPSILLNKNHHQNGFRGNYWEYNLDNTTIQTKLHVYL